MLLTEPRPRAGRAGRPTDWRTHRPVDPRRLLSPRYWLDRSGFPTDRGFTLIEMLLAVVILGIIIIPLGNAAIGLMRVTDMTSRLFSENHDAEMVTAYFAEDVRGLGTRDWSTAGYPLRQSVELDVGPAAGLYPCGAPSLPAAMVRLAWDNPPSVDAAPQVVRAAYVVVTAGAQRELHRVTCVDSATPVSDIVVVRNLAAAAPTVTCSSTCTAAPAVPATVTLTVRIDAGSGGTVVPLVLSGQRRQS